MSEFQNGIFEAVTSFLRSGALALTVIYTLGHILIAIVCVRVITGASLELATIDAFVEPVVNGFWFYLLHKLWTKE